jgi:hypothetical protein
MRLETKFRLLVVEVIWPNVGLPKLFTFGQHFCENNRDLPVLERYWREQEQDWSSKAGKVIK